MTDYMLLAGSTCLSPGDTITIRNNDGSAWLSLYGTRVNDDVRYGYNDRTGYRTFIRDGKNGVYFGSGCAECISVDFIAPHETRTYSYGGVTKFYPNKTLWGRQDAPPAYPFSAQVWSASGSHIRHAPDHRDDDPAAPARVVQGFMDGDQVSLWGMTWDFHNANKPYSAEQLVLHDGGDALRLELRAGDQWSGDLKEGHWQDERSMMQQAQSGAIVEGVTYRESWSFMISSSCPIGCKDQEYMGSYWLLGPGDIHSSCPGCLVPLQNEILPGGFPALDLDKGKNTLHAYWIGTQPLAEGVWHDEELEFNIDPTGVNGHVTMWLDGVKEYSYRGPLGEPNDQPYLQFEAYRADYDYAKDPTGPTIVYCIADVSFRKIGDKELELRSPRHGSKHDAGSCA